MFLEVVFLPYKACMFDSLESIWAAADADPECRAYVIPIPYYDKNPDGSFGEMHCERDLYPDYVPVTDWQTYNIEEHRPDIIFIHNPYDGGNKATSVHPDYYTKKLKGFTKLLAYVPYYVCIDDVPEHLCFNAAMLYADKVIVQSEKVRQTHIRIFREFEKEHNCIGKFGNAEKKFIALGSPKFDAVLTAKREDCQIPDEWKRLIEKPDGSRKEVVLYNTGISGLLNGNEKELRKMEDVFGFFKKRDGMVLLWRPHPLDEATCNAMRPRLLEEYKALEERYRDQGFGIYDDTADLHRAVAVSDAYYGDWGSLAALFQFAGKPVMIQNCDIIGLSGLCIYDICYDGANFWCTDFESNALYRINKKDSKVEYAGSFPYERKNKETLFGSVSENNEKLYFTPVSADGIGVYNIASHIFSRIELKASNPKDNPNYSPMFKFFGSVRHNEYIFFIPLSYPAIMRYNLLTEEIDYFSDWVAPLEELTSRTSGFYFAESAEAVNENIALAGANTNAVVMFNMDTCKSAVYEVGSKICRYNSICFDGKDYWLSPCFCRKVVRWSHDTLEFKEFSKFPDGIISEKIGFGLWDVRYINRYVYLFPILFENIVFKIDIYDETISEAFEFKTEYRAECYSSVKKYGDSIYVCALKSNILIEYDFKLNKRTETPLKLTGKHKEAVYALKAGSFIKGGKAYKTVFDCLYYETTRSSLNYYIDFVCNQNFQREMNRIADKQKKFRKDMNARLTADSGQTIYEYCKKELSS